MLLGPLLGVPRIDLAPPGTVKALPGSFSTPRTGHTTDAYRDLSKHLVTCLSARDSLSSSWSLPYILAWYGKVYSWPSVIVAHTSDGYRRDA